MNGKEEIIKRNYYCGSSPGPGRNGDALDETVNKEVTHPIVLHPS